MFGLSVSNAAGLADRQWQLSGRPISLRSAVGRSIQQLPQADIWAHRTATIEDQNQPPSQHLNLIMQFVANGPDLPEALLQAHEEGRVVFFCGAGISYPAGLPGFKGLVDEIYRRVGTTRSAIEQEAYARGEFDATLDLLERRLPGQRIAVRKALAQVLQPKWRRKGATDTHTALLQLARCREGSVRLVTTNFDRPTAFLDLQPPQAGSRPS